MPPSRPLVERFWEKVEKGPGCWLWTASRNEHGYGRIGAGRTSVAAHRVAWEIEHGPIPAGLLVCHHCDNPPCVNPAHLFLGTVLDNNMDCNRKGRRRFSHPGEDNQNARLTERQVEEIRKTYATGEVSQRLLADMYGVTQPLVSAIVNGNAWATHPAPLQSGADPHTVRRRERRRQVLAAVHANPGHTGSIARAVGLAHSPVRRDLDWLEAQGLVTGSKRDDRLSFAGRVRIYWAAVRTAGLIDREETQTDG